MSICMATYNGAKYISEQITSILSQLNEDDEMIIVDDGSTDKTLSIIQEFKDPRIIVYINERNFGHVYSFNRAISLANNKIMFMSDQDDLWIENRINLMSQRFTDTGICLISSNFELMDQNGNKLTNSLSPLRDQDSKKYISNIIGIFIGKRIYYGCAMAFNKEMKKYLIPIPNFVESHDLWIALAGNVFGANIHMNEKTLYRRIHPNNVSTVNRKFTQKIFSRFIYIRSVIVLLYRFYTK